MLVFIISQVASPANITNFKKGEIIKAKPFQDGFNYTCKAMKARLFKCGKRILENIRYSVFDIPEKGRFCILYFTKANGKFSLNGSSAKISQGSFFICSGKDNFSFSLLPKSKTVFYFAEFTPDNEDFLSTFNLDRGVFPSYRERELKTAFALLINESIQNGLYHDTKMNLFLVNLLYTLSEARIKPPNGFEQIVLLAKAINSSFSKSSIDVAPYAADAKLSKDRLSVIFKNVFSLPPHQYHTALKMDEAGFLLRHSNFSINEISKLLGYSNQFYFSSAYKKEKGEQPTQTRKKWM